MNISDIWCTFFNVYIIILSFSFAPLSTTASTHYELLIRPITKVHTLPQCTINSSNSSISFCFCFNILEDHTRVAPNDTAYNRWSCHSGLKLLCKLCRTSPPPAMGARFTVFWGMPAMRTKAGDVETNPGPTTLNKKVWICDICHKQIHVRKQISIRCNRIEHWVHLRCAGIRQAQYTDTWTCHLHRKSRFTPHTDITPPHRSRPGSKPLPTPHLHHRNQNTDTCPTLPLPPQDW